jgi:threonine dehydratase
MNQRLSLERIAQASTVIEPAFRDSPQFDAQSIGARLGCRVVVKVETLNPIRSFKARGAQFFVSQTTGKPHLVCASSGNFGQGMACAARRRGLPITVFTSIEANPLKVERMRALDAEVRSAGDGPDDAIHAAQAFAAEMGALLVEDGREPAIAEGAGTIGSELLRWPERFDALLVPVGDGALLGGIGTWVKAHSPTTRLIGVCAAGSPAMERSWRAGRVIAATPRTIAEGIAVQTPWAEALADLRAVMDDVLFVDDDALIAAMRVAHRDLGLVLEPSGAASLAAVLTHADRFRDQLVGTVLTGGNVTVEQMRRWL